jgi:hypothetical protein
MCWREMSPRPGLGRSSRTESAAVLLQRDVQDYFERLCLTRYEGWRNETWTSLYLYLEMGWRRLPTAVAPFLRIRTRAFLPQFFFTYGFTSASRNFPDPQGARANFQTVKFGPQFLPPGLEAVSKPNNRGIMNIDGLGDQGGF